MFEPVLPLFKFTWFFHHFFCCMHTHIAISCFASDLLLEINSNIIYKKIGIDLLLKIFNFCFPNENFIQVKTCDVESIGASSFRGNLQVGTA